MSNILLSEYQDISAEDLKALMDEMSAREPHLFDADPDKLAHWHEPVGQFLSPIEILMVLPYEITLADPIRVCCRGQVQRTESQSEGKVDVAVAVEKYEFLRSDEPAA